MNINIFNFKYEYEENSVGKYLANTNITIQCQLFEYHSNIELFTHLWIHCLERTMAEHTKYTKKTSEHTNQCHATTESETPTGDCSNKHHYWSADLRDRMKMLRISRRCKKTIERYKNTMQTSLLTNGLEAPKAADSYEGVVNSNRPLIASTRWSKKCKRRWWWILYNAKDYDSWRWNWPCYLWI